MIETIVGADERKVNGTPSDRHDNVTSEPVNVAWDPRAYGGLSLLRRLHWLCRHVTPQLLIRQLRGGASGLGSVDIVGGVRSFAVS